jgi:hypothetical protein
MSFALATQTALGGEYSGAVQMIFAKAFLLPKAPSNRACHMGVVCCDFRMTHRLSRVSPGSFLGLSGTASKKVGCALMRKQ